MQVKRQNGTYIFFQSECPFGGNHKTFIPKVQFELQILLVDTCRIVILEISHKNKTGIIFHTNRIPQCFPIIRSYPVVPFGQNSLHRSQG